MLSAFSENLIANSIRVYPPRRYVLLCGGEVSDINAGATPLSIRDAFLRGPWSNALKNTEILQIEEIEEFFDKASPYVDLVQFESDIAQICELVLLFSESPGSFTELGSFSMIGEIKDKLLLVIRSKYLSRSSFITKGPVLNLRRDYPNSVFSVIDRRLGIKNDMISEIDCDTLVNTLKSPIDLRLKQAESRTTLDTSKFNHLCKAYVGLLREGYSLKDDELLLLLAEIGFDVDEMVLGRVAFCCSALRWAANTLAGFDRVHYALPGNEAAKFEFRMPLADKIRRRAEFRQFWENSDPDRVAAVDQELAR